MAPSPPAAATSTSRSSRAVGPSPRTRGHSCGREHQHHRCLPGPPCVARHHLAQIVWPAEWQTNKAGAEFADKVSAVFVPFVVMRGDRLSAWLGAAEMGWTLPSGPPRTARCSSPDVGVSVVVIAARARGLATPTAVRSGRVSARPMGIPIKGGRALEVGTHHAGNRQDGDAYAGKPSACTFCAQHGRRRSSSCCSR